MSFFNELERRNVLRVGAAYVVVAWLLIQVTETIFPLFGFDDSPARIVVIVLAIGFIPALVLAWAFDMTPEGLKKESEIDRSQPVLPDAGRKLNRSIMIVLALALGYFAVDKFVLGPQRETRQHATLEAEVANARQQGRKEGLVVSYGDKSIAVMPFIDMSSNKDQEYMSDGVAEELLNLLAKIPNLRVISRSSAFSYKGKDVKLSQVASELNVAHIMEGSVRTAGNRIRVTAKLIEANSDTQLWSETYDRELNDIFTVQDEIATAVVSQLKIILLAAAPSVKKTDPEAYAIFLQARHLSRMGTSEAAVQATQKFKQVLTIDPSYSDGWSELGLNQLKQARFNLTSEELAFTQARESLNRALKSNPDNAVARSRLGWIAMFRGDLVEAARQLQKALQLEPGNTHVLGNVGQLLSNLGRDEQAIQLHTRALDLDPTSAASHWTLSEALYTAERMNEALAAAQLAERMSPGGWGVPYTIGSIYLYRQDYESALDTFAKEGSGELRASGTAMTLFSLGRRDDFEAALKQLQDDWGVQRPSEVAAVYIWTREYDAAFEWLNRAAESRDRRAFLLIHNPLFADIHGDSRWLPFLESIGRSPEQLSAIEFKMTLSE